MSPSPTQRPGAAAATTITGTDLQDCPAAALLRRMGDKWSPVVMALLAEGSRGFNELDRSIDGLSRRMLVRTLRMLERDGLVSRTVRPTRPIHVDYALTDFGHSLRTMMAPLAGLAHRHRTAAPDGRCAGNP